MVLQDNLEIKEMFNLELLARQVVEGFIIGLHKSPFHGFSAEFAEHRLYNVGESTKNIDWRVYGKTDKLFVKRFEEETNLRCHILFDVSSSMYFPHDAQVAQKKIGFSALAAASIMNILMRQRDAFGLSVFDNIIHEQISPKTSLSHYRNLIGILDKYLSEPDVLNKKTSAIEAIHQIADSINKRALVCIFSDMFDFSQDREALFSALQHLKFNKHEVILFHVVDKQKEVNFEYENRPTLFVDIETGEKIRLQPHQIKDTFTRQLTEFNNDLLEQCLMYRIDYVPCDINEGFKNILQTFLAKRAKVN